MITDKKQLGIFWDSTALYFVESNGTRPLKSFAVLAEDKSSTVGGALIPKTTQLVTKIQESLKIEKVATRTVNLSLPTKDIIFRSFIIPFMQPKEIKGVVDFEAKKYIPFPLSELTYAFHPMILSETGSKKIRVIFVAIKKDAITHYSTILEQASLAINTIEPSSISFMRALAQRELLPENETVAIVERGEKTGSIIILDQGVPQFVREFQLKSPFPTKEELEPKAIITRLINEIRISLDYFNRQDSHLHAKKILFLDINKSPAIAEELKKNLDMDIVPVNHSTLIPQIPFKEIGTVHAYGASLEEFVSIPATFNLSDKKVRSMRMGDSKSMSTYRPVVLTALCCAALLIGAYVFFNTLLSKPGQQNAQLVRELDKHSSMTVDRLTGERDKYKDKLTYLKNVRTSSQIAQILAILPHTLPEQTWLNTIDLTYIESQDDEKPYESKTRLDPDGQKAQYDVNLKITGYAYHDNSNEQFRVVNQLLRNLKGHKEFSSLFTKVDLETVVAQKINDFDVTFFDISCQ